MAGCRACLACGEVSCNFTGYFAVGVTPLGSRPACCEVDVKELARDCTCWFAAVLRLGAS